MLAENKPRHILDEPIPEGVEKRLPGPFQPKQPFINLDIQVPPPVRLPADELWVEILKDAKDDCEVDGATTSFSTWRVETEDSLDIGGVEIADGIEARAGRMVLGASMTDGRAERLLATLYLDTQVSAGTKRRRLGCRG